MHKHVHAPGERHYRRTGSADGASVARDSSTAPAANGAANGGPPGEQVPAAAAQQEQEQQQQQDASGMNNELSAGMEGSLRGRGEGKEETGPGCTSHSRSSSRSRSRGRRGHSPGRHHRSPSGHRHKRSHSTERSRSRSKSRSKSRSLSADGGKVHKRRHYGHGHGHRHSHKERHHERDRSRERDGERDRGRHGQDRSGERRGKEESRRGHGRSGSRERRHGRESGRGEREREREREGQHHQQRKRSRSSSQQRSPRAQQAQQQAQQQARQQLPAPLGRHESSGAEDGGEALERDGSGGASSLVKLSLLQASVPSPATAATAGGLAAPPSGPAAAAPSVAPAAAAVGPLAGPSPAPPAGMLRVHTPSAAALAAAQGIDLSEVPLVQPSPMAAEATVAALSALMRQPARQPSLHGRHRSLSGLGLSGLAQPGSATAAAAGKQLLSFGDEMAEDEAEGSAGMSAARLGGGLSAATSKRFKHEKTLVMLNPLLTGMHPLPYPDEEELPVSPAAPLDRRLGQVLWGSAQAKGMRPYMEDRHTIVTSFTPRTSTGQAVQDGVFRAYASVFDGHNGASAAEHACDRVHHVLAAEHALRSCTGEGPPAAVLQEEERVAAALVHSFETVDREIMTRCRMEGTKGGATGLVLLRIGNQLYAAHCGDTRAVLQRNGEALRLTEDHKPNLPRERKRVEGLGGRVDFARCWRVIVEPGDGRPASGLAVSRSFGDPDFKEPLHLVTATPDVIRERLLPGDDFVILASDGLWDVMSDSDACAVVRRHLQQSGNPRQITPPQLIPGAAAFGNSAFADQMRRPVVLTTALATAAAERLVQESLDRGTMDNVTAVVGLLQWD